jgi:hypothetical protein
MSSIPQQAGQADDQGPSFDDISRARHTVQLAEALFHQQKVLPGERSCCCHLIQQADALCSSLCVEQLASKRPVGHSPAVSITAQQPAATGWELHAYKHTYTVTYILHPQCAFFG